MRVAGVIMIMEGQTDVTTGTKPPFQPKKGVAGQCKSQEIIVGKVECKRLVVVAAIVEE